MESGSAVIQDKSVVTHLPHRGVITQSKALNHGLHELAEDF